MEVEPCASVTQMTALDVTEAVRKLKVITSTCINDQCDINNLLERFESATFNEKTPKMVAQAEGIAMLSSTPHFAQTINVAVTHIIQSVTRLITDLMDQRDNNNESLQGVIGKCYNLRHFFQATSGHFHFNTSETAVCAFLAELLKLLRKSDFTMLANIPVLNAIGQMVQVFRDVSFTRPVVLLQLSKNVEIMRAIIVVHDQCFLFETGFYEKLLHSLLLLKDLLEFCVQMGDIYHSDSYQLDRKILEVLQKLLEELVSSVPAYLMREVQECLNLVIP